MRDTVRVLRLLEYSGPREDIERMIAERSVKGQKTLPHDRVTIREAVLGEFPELLVRSIEEKKPC